MLAKLKSNILSLLFPQKCLICQHICKAEICDNCQNNLLQTYQEKITLNIENIASIKVLYVYNEQLKKILWLIKYRSQKHLINYVDHKFLKINLPPVDLVIPVPIHPLRFQERGFNQASLIFQKLITQRVLSVNENIVIRQKATDKMATQNRQQRAKQICGSFKIIDSKKQFVNDKKILIVDDILTTGFTVQELAGELKRAGAKEIHLLVLSRPAILKNEPAVI